MTPFAKVYFRRPGGVHFQIGPLGYWKVGDTPIMEDGTILVVGSLDLDGMAHAYPHEAIEKRAWDKDTGFQHELDQLARVRSGPEGWMTALQLQQCRNIAAAGAQRRAEDDARCPA